MLLSRCQSRKSKQYIMDFIQYHPTLFHLSEITGR